MSEHRSGFKQKEDLTEFGRYFYLVCERLQVSGDQIAAEAGIDHSTKSKITRVGRNKPQYETVEKIVKAMSQHKGWLDKDEINLFNLARYAAPEQYNNAVRVAEDEARIAQSAG